MKLNKKGRDNEADERANRKRKLRDDRDALLKALTGNALLIERIEKVLADDFEENCQATRDLAIRIVEECQKESK